HSTSNSDPRIGSDDDQLARLKSFADSSQRRRRPLVDFVNANGSPAVVRAMDGQWAMGTLFQQLRESRYTFSERARALVQSLRRWDTFEVQNYIMAIPL